MVELQFSEPTNLSEIPFTRVDALLVLGIGGNTRFATSDRYPIIEERRMRMNAIAAKELAANRTIPDTAVIIPTGQGTELVDYHYQRLAKRQQTELNPEGRTYREYQDLQGQPINEAELKRAAAVSQGELMTDLIGRAGPKGGKGKDISRRIQAAAPR